MSLRLKHVLLFGATRGVGLELARLLRKKDIMVSAMVRNTSQISALRHIGVRISYGDATSPQEVTQALGQVGEQAHIISTLSGCLGDGRFTDEVGNINVIEAAVNARAQHMTLITSLGCGETAPYASPRARAAFGAVVDAKTRAEERLKQSGLAHVIVRPGGLVDREQLGRGILTSEPAVHGYIGRAELARLVSLLLEDERALGQAFVALDADQARCAHPFERYQPSTHFRGYVL